MRIIDLLQRGKPCVSFEFFPPKTDEGMASLLSTVATLKSLDPSFVSMTYGAGGSTRSKTVGLVAKIKHEIGIESVAHLTCVGHTKDELNSVLAELQGNGIDNVLALRGDPPKGQTTFVANRDGFSYASELVRFIKERFSFCVGVAGYPEKHIEAPSMQEDLRHLKEKVDAGADVIITQLFFNNADYFSFVDSLRARGISAPVIAGIMPIVDTEQIKRFAGLCGAVLPSELLKKLEAASDDKEQMAAIGVEHAFQQCRDLLRSGAPGLHFYTLNKSHSTQEIFLKLKSERLV
jgi:methylenetetrahydrofolate reductase (NADPH)